MNNNDQIQQVEVSLEEARRVAELGAALNRLENNRDFQAVILHGYLRDEAVRLVAMTAEPHIKDAGRADVFAGIRGVAELRQYLMKLRAFGEIAAKEIIDLGETLSELHEEG